MKGPARTSLSWRVNAERVALLGWSRAILMQLAHSKVAAGVFDHSGFRDSPLAAVRRLHHTVKAMLSLTFGDEAARDQTIAGILAIHRRVHGHLVDTVGPFPAGTSYSAEDPALVLWVHATLLESVPLLHERLVAPLSDADHDAYCMEAAPVAIALGARPADVPRSRAALRGYLDATYRSGVIAVGPQARQLSNAILYPSGSLAVAPAVWLNSLITIGLLPPAIREDYGFTWTGHQQRTLTMVLRTGRTLRRLTPDRLAWWHEARQ